VLPDVVRVRIAVEAAVPFGWEKYTGSYGTILGLDRFGASAPYQELYKEFGLTVENIVRLAEKLVEKII